MWDGMEPSTVSRSDITGVHHELGRLLASLLCTRHRKRLSCQGILRTALLAPWREAHSQRTMAHDMLSCALPSVSGHLSGRSLEELESGMYGSAVNAAHQRIQYGHGILFVFITVGTGCIMS